MTAQDALVRPHPAKLTVEDFLVLDRSGAFTDHAKTELIDGTVIVVNAQYSEHFTVKTILLRRLADACDGLGRGLEAWSEGSIAIPPRDVPEPDLFVTRVRPVKGLVRAETVALVVEIATTSLSLDLGRKLKLYAAAGIAEYWVVDVEARIVHQMWSPEGEAYAEAREAAFGERIEAATIEGLAVETGGIG
jgi:Uma2 family endonuclease